MQWRYLDSDVFLGLFNEEPDKVEMCKGVLQAAERGDLRVVVSALTLTEVVRIKGHHQLPRENEEKIRTFFEAPYIYMIDVTRPIAEFARQLVWEHNVQPKDAIHIATALQTDGVEILHTFDQDLLKLDGQLGNPPLRICKPDLPGQMVLSI